MHIIHLNNIAINHAGRIIFRNLDWVIGDRDRVGLVGPNGAGKSTLINQLMPGVNLKTQEVSDWSGKGQHTTTFAEMFDLPGGGRKVKMRRKFAPTWISWQNGIPLTV